MSDWLNNGWLIVHKTNHEEIRHLLRLADRDLADCRNRTLSADWRFNIAYNAALQCANAALAAAGYRAAKDERPWGHTLLTGKDGPLPPFLNWPPSGQEQWCGYYAMRSDWGKEARYLCIDCGPWGTTHVHGDRLSFVLDACGERFIIDPSSTRYASNAPGAFISVQRAGFLHNAITVDGLDAFIDYPCVVSYFMTLVFGIAYLIARLG